MKDLYFTYNKQEDYDRLLKIKGIEDYFLHTADSGTLKGKKEAYKIKSEWGAKLDPFLITYNDERPIKAFYSECPEDAIQQFSSWIKNKGV